MKKNKLIIISVSIVLIIFLVLFLILGKNRNSTKYTFIFPEIKIDNTIEVEEKLVVENRFLQSNPSQGSLNLFIEELILGPKNTRLRPLFALGTSVEFCFLNNDVLYVSLSKEALDETYESTNIQNGISLFKENIKKNFKNINEIVLFIDGIVVNE